MYSTRDVSDYVTPRNVDVKRCSDLSFHTTRRFVMAASRDRVKDGWSALESPSVARTLRDFGNVH